MNSQRPEPVKSYSLAQTFKALAERGKKALVAYVVAGDPEPSVTLPLMHRLVAAGVDIIELGVPFSDPEAEGPVIQLAHERALAHKTSLRDCLDMTARFRQDNSVTPVILMGYLNPIDTMGYATFVDLAAKAGVSGTIIVNLPPEERGDLGPILETQGIDNICLLAPTTSAERAAYICHASRGFIYYVSLRGTTGAATLDLAEVATRLEGFRALSTLPMLVGFGIKDGASARAVTRVADGAILGSVIVNLMAECTMHPTPNPPTGHAILLDRVADFVSSIRSSIDD